MRTGVYGGTFNPIHRGHVHILGEFIRRRGLDRTLLIPAGTPPHKVPHALAAPEDRVRMCRLAAESLPGKIEISTIELDRPGKSFTSETLTELAARYPGDEFFFLMGEDMFLTVDRWHDPDTIFRLAALCASPRSPEGMARLLAQKQRLETLGARCCVEDIPFLDISSTQVRERVIAGKPIASLVPDEVAAYIEEHHIYGGEPHDL